MKAKGALFNIPGHGHVNPTLAMVKELVDRGNQIDYYCTEEFREKIEQTGARFIALPNELIKEETLKNFDLLSFCIDIMEETIDLMPDLLEEVKEEQYDYILTDLFAPWGRIVAQQLNLPVMVLFACFGLRQDLKSPPNMLLQFLATPFQTFKKVKRLHRAFQAIKTTYAPKGIHKLDDFLVGDLDCPCLVFTAQAFQPQAELFPDNYSFTGPSINTSLPKVIPDFPYECLEGQEVIYISLGSIVSNIAFYKKCIKAFRDTNYLVIMNISPYLNPEELAAPDNVILCNYVPQLAVLKQATVFITHGGMNSAHEGIYFEVPMLVVPQVSDQFLVAKAIHDKQLGLWKAAWHLTPSKLLNLVEQLKKDASIKRQLSLMSKALKEAGGYVRAADEVEQFYKEKQVFHV